MHDINDVLYVCCVDCGNDCGSCTLAQSPLRFHTSRGAASTLTIDVNIGVLYKAFSGRIRQPCSQDLPRFPLLAVRKGAWGHFIHTMGEPVRHADQNLT